MSEIKTNKISSLDSSNSDITLDPDGTGDTIVASGNVGIGTTSPASAAGNALVVHDTSAPRIRLTSNTTGEAATDGAEISLLTSAFVVENREASDTIFFNNGAERLRILSGGGLTFNGDTAAANALDDYEEGTWTPVLRAETSNLTATYIEQVGRYVRVGKLVHVQCRMQGSVTNAGSGARFIDGLPYTNVNAGADTGSGSVCPFNGLMGNNYYFATGHGVNNAASFRLKIQTNLDGTLSDISSGTGGFAIDFSYTYRSQS
jgi:hypothetical protein